MHVCRLPGYPRTERRKRKGGGSGAAFYYPDAVFIHHDEKHRWTWAMDEGTGDVFVWYDYHKGWEGYAASIQKHPTPEMVYGVT